MPNIRNFAVLIILILSLAVSQPAVAQTLTPTPDPCSPDAPLSVPCPVKYDTTNVVITPPQSWITSLLQSVATLVGANINWIGTLRPLDNTYGIGSDTFTALSKQIKQASENELKPATLQAITTPDLQPKPFTMTSVLYVTDPKTGAVTQITSPDRIVSEDVPGLKDFTQASQELGSDVTGWTTTQDYNLKNIVVSTDKVDPGPLPKGQDIKQTTVTTQNGISYGGNSIISIIENFIAQIGSLFQTGTTQTAQIQGKGLTPWIHYPLCLFAGCTSSDVSSVTYDPKKEKAVQAGGAVTAMYKPADIDDTFKSEVNAQNPTQAWNLTKSDNSAPSNPSVQGVASDVITTPAVNFGQARIEAAGTYMNCTLSPAGIQGPECNENWANASPSTEGGWNCDTSIPEQSISGLQTDAAQARADTWFKYCPNGKDNAWKQCHNDVIATARKACVDPLFALAIWIHESGASNYTCSERLLGGQKVEDFGQHSSLIPTEDFKAQLNEYIKRPRGYIGNCPDLTLQNFFARFGPGVYTPSGHYQCYNELTKANRDIVDTMISEMQEIYSSIAPGVPLPAWPGAASCTTN